MADDEQRFGSRRAALMRAFFPAGIPRLWCPPLTHYTATGVLDFLRIRAHVRHLQPWVKGFLVPGSTGDGWELDDAETRELLAFWIDEARSLGVQMLVGILRPDPRDALRLYSDTLAWLRERAGAEDIREALLRSAVCGFTICAPRGADRTQEEIREALASMLRLDVPTALYQLPQVTQNEMAPDTVRGLAAAYPNFYLVKDTSGADRIALSGLRDVFLVRGAEGDYSRHFAASGGRYDGFLLGAANCFPRELADILDHLLEGRREEADALSRRLTDTINAVFGAVANLPDGNAFTNANKAMDHFFAFGAEARRAAPPKLHSGNRIPGETIDAVGAILERDGWLPRRGYLEVA